MKIEILGMIKQSTTAASISRLAKNKDEEWAKKIYLQKHHKSIGDHDVWTLKISDVTRHSAGIIGERRLLGITEQSLRYTKAIKAYELTDLLELYNDALRAGVKKQDARYLLPTTVLTQVIVTINREELEVLINRLRNDGQWDAPDLANVLEEYVYKWGKVENDGLKDGDYVMGDEERDYWINGEMGSRGDEFNLIKVSSTLSMVAYRQLRRHRMMSRMYGIIEDAYKCPESVTNLNKAIEIADMEGVTLDASAVGFTMIMNSRSFKHFLRLRTHKSAQKEIRDFAKGLENDFKLN